MIRSFGGSIISGNSEWQSSNKNICKSNIKYDSVWNKKGCYLQLLTPEMMKLLESTKSKITDENDENVPPLEITKLVLSSVSIKSFLL